MAVPTVPVSRGSLRGSSPPHFSHYRLLLQTEVLELNYFSEVSENTC